MDCALFSPPPPGAGRGGGGSEVPSISTAGEDSTGFGSVLLAQRLLGP